ncbi:ABC transporter ATP-binding protein [Pantoea sp. At-9b]|uniref:ABC transporter ATP-binding protein n=1 Tax=Pantoea sp. (strain At-9b) TaxID=592316 RepID=UPI0001B3FBCA|nr:ABC transporter ATP-binding protein [Pantoea sp. At-9b]ADU72916.1 ABC transporter related protein [Pantoea sp. At-9b]
MTAHSSCRLEIDRLDKIYPGGVLAADRISLTVEPGEVLALLGPSGCGKTTLLQSIAGFVSPDNGDIRLDNQSILATAPEQRRTAMVFQQYALFPHMTVRDNIGFGLRMMRVSRQAIAQRVDEVLKLVRIDALAERRPGQLSGGQKQRVALARAIVTEPRLLLLDEPLGALDQNLREEMQVEIRKLQKRLGLTTVMVTHDQREAIVLADRIAVMKAGRIEQIGTASEIYDRPRSKYVATFTGVENVLPVRRLSPGSASLAGFVLDGLHDNGSTQATACLAVRSEAISLMPGELAGHINGEIRYVQLLGASMRYEVEIGLNMRVVVTEVRRDNRNFAIGDRVSLQFAAQRCCLLDD